jgi:hypothetical protein
MPVKPSDILKPVSKTVRPENITGDTSVFNTANKSVESTYDQSYSKEDIDLINSQIPGGLTNPEQLENLKALNQSTTSKLSNDFTAATLKTATGLVRDVGLVIGGINYLSNSANPNKDATYEDFKNPLVEGTEELDRMIEEALPHYLTTDEKDNPAAFRNLFSSAFLGKTVLRDGVPFAATAWLEGMGLGKVAASATKIAYAQRLAKLGGEFTETGMKLAKNINWANKQVIGTLVNYNEAAFESLNTSDRVYEITKQGLLKDGVSEELADKKAKEAADNAFENSFIINFAVLRATDYQFDGLFKTTLNSRRNTKEILKELTNKEQTVSTLSKLGKNIVSESAQELTQGSVGSSLEESALEGKTPTLFETFGDSLSNIPKRMTTDEGIIEMLSSAFIAAGTTGLNSAFGFKDERNNRAFRKEQFDKSISGETTLKPEEVINQTSGNITQKGKEILSTLSNFAELEVIKNAAVANNNSDLYQKAFDIQLSNMAYGHFEAGLGQELESKLRGQIEVLKSDLSKSGKKTITDHETNQEVTPEEYIQKVISRSKRYESIYNSIQDQFDVQDPTIRKSLYLNAVQQSETKDKINKAVKATGEKFLSYVNSDKELSKLPIQEAYNKLLDKRDSITSTTEKAVLQTLVDDYLQLSDLFVNGSIEEQLSNKQNLNNNLFNKKYYDFLKQNFDILVNPDSKFKKQKEELFKKAEQRETKVTTDLVEDTLEAEKPVKKAKAKQQLVDEDDIIDTGESQDIMDILKQYEDQTDVEDIVETEPADNTIIIPSAKEEGTYIGDIDKSSIKVAYLSKTWTIEDSEGNAKRNDLGLILDQFIENSNPNKLNAGSKVIVKKEPSKIKYSYKSNSKGDIEYELDSLNQPIKRKAVEGEFDLNIYDENSNYIGSLHEPNWMLIKKNSVYVNSTEELIATDYHKLVDIWNSFEGSKVVPVESKSIGRINTERIENKAIFNSLTDSIGTFISNRVQQVKNNLKPVIGIVNGNFLGFGKKAYIPEDNNCYNSLVDEEGNFIYPRGSVVLLAEGANGQDIILPLNVNKLGDNAKIVTKVLRMLKAVSKNDLTMFQSLGYSSFNGSTIKEYLSNFIYLQDYSNNKAFSNVTKSSPIKLGIRSDKDIIDIRATILDAEGQIKTLVLTDIKNQDIEAVNEFLKEITPALESAYFNINKNNLDLFDTEFKVPVFEGNKIKEVINYKNYIDFISTNSLTTDIREFGNGYLFLQPVIRLNEQSLLDNKTNKEEQIVDTFENPFGNVTTEEELVKQLSEEDEFVFPDEDPFSDSIKDLTDNQNIESTGLTYEQQSYLNSIIESEYIKDKEGNKFDTLNKQDLFRDIILSNALKDLRHSIKPSEAFSRVHKLLKNGLTTIEIYKKINSDNYTKAKASSSAPVLLKNSESFEDFKSKADNLLKAEDDLKFVTKSEVFSEFVNQLKPYIKNKYKINIDLDNSILEEELIDSENTLDDTDDSVERVENEIGDKEKRSAQADSSEVDPKKHLSWKMKMFLSDIPMEITYNGLTLFYDYNKVYSKVLDILSNPISFEFEDVIKTLENSNNYIAAQVAKKLLNENDPQVLNQFFTSCLLEKSNYSMEEIDIKINKDKKSVSSKTYNSNRNDTLNVVLDSLSEGLKTSVIATNINGEYYINKDVVNNIVKQFEQIQKTEDLFKRSVFIKGLFKALNIKYLDNNTKLLSTFFSVDKLNNYYSKSESFKTPNDLFNDKGLFGLLISRLSKNIESKDDILISANNPFKGDSKQGVSSKLAQMISDTNDISGAINFKNLEGKSFYSFNLRTYLSDSFYKIVGNKSLGLTKLNNAFSSTSKYLKKESLKALNYFDGISFGRSDFEKKRRTDLDISEQMLAFLTEFDNSNFFLPTLSDKTKSPLIKALLNQEDKVKVTFEDNNLIFDKVTIERVRNIINAELNRIIAFENYKKEYVEAGGKLVDLQKELGNYYEGAGLFYLFPELNSLDIKTLNFDNFISGKLNEFVKYSEAKLLSNNINLDFIPNELKSKYDYVKEESNKLKAVVADITVNYMEFYTNYMQIFGGDPALFFKKSKIDKSTLGNIKSTLEEFTKRLAKDIAPGIQGKWKNKNYQVVFVKTLEVDIASKNEYIKNLFGEKNYVADTTDAQEFTTLKEHLEVMYAYGKEVDRSKYINFIDRLEKNPEAEFTEEELSTILNKEVLLANKPVQVYSAPKTTKDGKYTWNNIYYIKSSSIPLIPQYTKNTPLDVVRKAMQESNIARLAFDSAVKAGKSQIVDLFNDSNDINYALEDLKRVFNDNSHLLNREGFRIQQELPYKKDKFEILVVSQMNKLIFDNILDIEGFELNGNTYSGRDLKEIKESVRKTLFNISYEEVKEKLGVKIIDDSVEITDMSKLINSLKQEAVSRNYPVNDIESLTLDVDGKLIIPLAYNNSFSKFESLISSMFSKIVLQKQTGKSYVQTSGVGLKYMNEVNSSDIVYTSDFDKSKGLSYIDVNKPYAEVLISWPFEENIKKFIDKETGLIDFTKLDSKVLEFVGARIPNQSFSSQLPIKVVGFLPSSLQDIIIIPDGITKQMGSDFDIDKLYAYISNYEVTEEGILKTINYSLEDLNNLSKEQLQNIYKDLHWSILTNPEVTKKVVQPLDKPDLVEETKLILETTGEGSSTVSFNPLLWVNQIENYNSQKAAKQLVGSSSLYTTFNTLIQDLDLRISEDFKKNYGSLDIFGLELEYLSNPKGTSPITSYNGENRTVSDNLITMQNAFLDNAKDPIAGKLGINDISFGPLAILTMLKDSSGNSLNLSYIARFVKQPVIQEYLDRISKDQSSLSDSFGFGYDDTYKDFRSELFNNLNTETTPVKLDNEELLKLLNPKIKKDEEFYNKQINLLDTFYKLQKIADYIFKLQSSSNSDSKGSAKSFVEIIDKKNKIRETIFDKSLISGASELFSRYVITEVGLATEYAVDFPLEVFKKELPFVQDWYIKIEKQIGKALGKDRISKDLKKNIWKSFRSFMFTNDNLLLFDGDITALRKELLTGKNSLANRLITFKDNPLYANNLLIQRLFYELDDKSINKVLYRASTDESTEEKEITRAFLSLLTGNSQEQSFARDLIAYNYITGGNQTSVGFAKYIPTGYLFTTNYKDIDNLDYNSINSEAFVRQFVQNNYDIAKKVSQKQFDSFFKIDGNLATIKKFTDNPLLNQDQELIYSYIHIQESGKDNVHYLYELNEGTNTYVRIPLAGTYKVGFDEYNFKEPMISSIIESNNQGSIKTISEIQVPKSSNKRIENTADADTEYVNSLFQSFDKKGLVNAISNISETTTDNSLRTIADLIVAGQIMIPDNIKVEIVNENFRGQYSYKTINDKITNSTIFLSPKGERKTVNNSGVDFKESTNETILHETLHAFTVGYMNFYKKNTNNIFFNNNPRLKDLSINLDNLYEQAKSEFKKLGKLDSTKAKDMSLISTFETGDIKEFLVRVLTDKNVQKFLSTIENKNKSLFDNIVDNIINLLKEIGKIVGISSDALDKSILKESILTSTELIDKLVELKTPTENIQSSTIDDLGTTVVKFMQELTIEERELFRELVKSGIITPKCD